MIRRVRKIKNNKQGAILVIVVLILALAMIFIASAMMLTQATRSRLYGAAKSSQARLTVTAASEVFLEALEKQEITDTQIDGLLSTPNRAASDAEKIRMFIDGVPGMSNEADNCTLLDVYYPDSSDTTIVYCDFTTTIGTDVENVRVVLQANNQDPQFGGIFKNQIDVAGFTDTSELRFTGGLGMVNPALGFVTDNTILFRDAGREQVSDSVFYSDLVFASGNFQPGGGNSYFGDLVFLQGAKMVGDSSVDALTGDFYFIGNGGDDPEPGFLHSGNDNIWGNITSKNFVFSGRGIQNSDSDQNGKINGLLNATDANGHLLRNCYFIGNSSGTVEGTNMKESYTVNNAGSSLSGTMNDKLTLYKAYDYSASGPNSFPSDVEKQVLGSFNFGQHAISAGTEITKTEYVVDANGNCIDVLHNGETADTDIQVIDNPVTMTYAEMGLSDTYTANHTMTITELFDKAMTADGCLQLDEGYYYITAGENGYGETCGHDHSGSPAIIAIDGAKATGYRFYFAAGEYQIRSLVFAVYNVTDTPNPVMFILEDGASLEFSHPNFKDDGLNNLCMAGFLSVNRGWSSAGACANGICNVEPTSEDIDWSPAEGIHYVQNYSQYYDGIRRPAVYIFGTGNNEFLCGDCMTLEAYVGLYGGSAFNHRNDCSTTIPIYGRIEANRFGGGIDNPTGMFKMPYCPAPSDVADEPDLRRAESKYKVVNIIYYYGDGSTPTPTT